MLVELYVWAMFSEGGLSFLCKAHRIQNNILLINVPRYIHLKLVFVNIFMQRYIHQQAVQGYLINYLRLISFECGCCVCFRLDDHANEQTCTLRVSLTGNMFMKALKSRWYMPLLRPLFLPLDMVDWCYFFKNLSPDYGKMFFAIFIYS